MSLSSHFVNSLVGEFQDLRRDPLALVMRMRRERGPIAHFRAVNQRIVLVSDPEHIEHVLKSKNYGKQTRGLKKLRIALRNGLLTSEGDLWLRQRRVAQPAFHRDCIARFAGVMVEDTQIHTAGWHAGETLDLAEEMMAVTLRIIGHTLFSTDLGAERDVIGESVSVINHEMRRRTFNFADLPMAFPTSANRKLRRSLDAMDAIVFRELAKRRGHEDEYHDLLSLLMLARDENGAPMSDEQLRDEFVTMAVAGHETTANALAWTFYLLSAHPEITRRLRVEITSVCGTRPPSFADVAQLKYARAVVSEAMRLYPPAWIIVRNAIADDAFGGTKVHAGSVIMLSPYVVHRDPEFWPNPEGFDPERFTSENVARPRYAYFPFGGGPRQCIGMSFAMMEAQLILVTILQKWAIALQPGARIEPQPLITLRPRYGVPVTISPAPASS